MEPKEVYTAIGLMSGTSLDGVDAAVLKTDGHGYVQPIEFLTLPYGEADREIIRKAFGKTDRENSAVKEAEEIVTNWHIKATQEVLKMAGQEVDLIGFHGQTIFHAPDKRLTIQIGDSQRLADETGIDVIADFRSADVKAGGEGAPLAPLYHQARVIADDIETPCAVLNIGGVANMTFIDGDDLLAFDCGPGNALMDDWIKEKTGQPYDEGGVLAASGMADERLVQDWLAHAYFQKTPPKSLDRDEWDIAAFGPLASNTDLSLEDGAATLLAFTVGGILKSLEHLSCLPKTIYACGGGRLNTELMKQLGAALKDKQIDLSSVDDLGWNGDALEAECFAYLAVCSKLGLPLSLPSTTGVSAPQTGGILYHSAA